MALLDILSPGEQVASHIRAELAAGTWVGRMPGVLRLERELGINRKTVEAGLRLLESEGLLVGQGPGRRRRIVSPVVEPQARGLRVALLVFDRPARGADYMIELRHLLEEAGHAPHFLEKTLLDLDMDARRVARFVKRNNADAWIVEAGTREVFEWFSTQPVPAFAIFGRRRGIPIAAAGPDKVPIYAEVTRRLINLGHRRIALLCRRTRRLPEPGRPERAFLETLQSANIRHGEFNLPNWEESKEGGSALLESMFRHTPPTALILDEPFLFNAALYFVTKRGLQVPEDVSLVCTDADPNFVWCEPSVAHIRWDYRPVVRRIVQWANNVSKGKKDLRQSLTKAEFVEGETMGSAP